VGYNESSAGPNNESILAPSKRKDRPLVGPQSETGVGGPGEVRAQSYTHPSQSNGRGSV